MASLIANLLQFSRRGTSRVSTLNLADEIEKTLELIQYQLHNNNIQVVQELASNDLVMSADRQQLRQLFLNLFTNASDAMPHGGTLIIRGRLEEAAPSSCCGRYA